MPVAPVASPQVSVRLFKTISRTTVDGSVPVSGRYAGKDASIDLTGFLDEGSSVRTSKSVREPAGGFSLTFADNAQRSGGALESVYALVEPMDIVEIRMWHGLGPTPEKLPIVMRGFVSDVQRQQTMTESGPQRQVIVSGQDYGKIWQMFQIIYLAAYAERQGLLTNYGLWEMFGMEAVNAMPAGDFVRTMVDKIINPHLAGFVPSSSGMPTGLLMDISVAHGMVNNSYQQMEGSIYDILRHHGDVGVWNELYTEDREDGVYAVYRPIPALHLGTGKKIQDDAPDPVYVTIRDDHVPSISVARSDASVANFYWVNNSRFDLIDETQRKLASIPADDGRVSIREYPNAAVKYYGVRAMYGSTQQGGDLVDNQTTGKKKDPQNSRTEQQEAWIDKRRRLMMEMNRDNVVFERGSARAKGGPMRGAGGEMMKAGDYARFHFGRQQFDAYAVQIDHEFLPFRGYTTTITFERCDWFAGRMQAGGGINSPWLSEQV